MRKDEKLKERIWLLKKEEDTKGQERKWRGGEEKRKNAQRETGGSKEVRKGEGELFTPVVSFLETIRKKKIEKSD